MERVYDRDNITFPLGTSVSVSGDGRIIAVGGPGDRNGVGAAWIFAHDGWSYQQLGL